MIDYFAIGLAIVLSLIAWWVGLAWSGLEERT